MAGQRDDAVDDHVESVSRGVDDEVIELRIVDVAIIEISHPPALVGVVPAKEFLDGSVCGLDTVSTIALGGDVSGKSANALLECRDDSHTKYVWDPSEQPLPSSTDQNDVILQCDVDHCVLDHGNVDLRLRFQPVQDRRLCLAQLVESFADQSVFARRL